MEEKGSKKTIIACFSKKILLPTGLPTLCNVLKNNMLCKNVGNVCKNKKFFPNVVVVSQWSSISIVAYMAGSFLSLNSCSGSEFFVLLQAKSGRVVLSAT